MSNSSFVKNAFIYGFGNIGVLVINFILVPFYTFYLNKGELGYYDFIVTTAALLAPFVTLQIEMALLRWLLDESQQLLKDNVIQNSLVILIVSFFIFSVIYVIIYLFFLFENGLLVYLFFSLFFIYPFLKQIVRGLGKSKQYVIIEIIYTTLFLIFAILFIVFFKWSTRGLFAANILSLFISILFILFYNKIFLLMQDIRIDWTMIKEMLKYSIPMVLNITSVWFMTSAIKYFIVFYLGYDSNGIYAVAYKFASIIQIVNTVFYLAWQEEAIRIYPDKKLHSRFETILKGYMGFLMILLFLIVGLQPFVISIAIGQQYHTVIEYIPIISLGFIFMCLGSFYGIVYQCEKKTGGLSISAVLSGFVVLVIGLLFNSKYSLYIASFSFLISFFIFFIYRLIDTRKYVKIQFPIFKFIIFTIFIGIIYYLSMRFESQTYIFLLIISSIGILFFNWSNIITLVNSVNFKKI